MASPIDSTNFNTIKSRFDRHILNGVELRLSAYEVLIFLLSKNYHIKLLNFIFNTHIKFRPLCFSKKSPNGVTYYEGIIPDLFGLMAEIFNLTYYSYTTINKSLFQQIYNINYCTSTNIKTGSVTF